MSEHGLEYPGEGPAFAATIERDEEWLVVRLRGELDLATVPRLNEVLADALTKRRPAIVLDLRDLTFLDSTGIQALVTFRRRATQDGAELKVRSVQPGPLKVITLTGLAGLFGLDASDEVPPADRMVS